MSYFDPEFDNNPEEKKTSDSDSDSDTDSDVVVDDAEVEAEVEEDEGVDDDDLSEDDDEEEEEEDEEEEEEEQTGGGDDEEEGEIAEDDSLPKKIKTKIKKIPAKKSYETLLKDTEEEEDEDEDADGEEYLQKFDKSINENYVLNVHPESVSQNYDEILTMTKVVRNGDGIIIDKLHRTIPYLTKYEKARILGQRAKQINSGAYPFIKVPENVIDGYIIAELELKQKRIPFIIRRPLPNGGSEYWKVQDLEDISF